MTRPGLPSDTAYEDQLITEVERDPNGYCSITSGRLNTPVFSPHLEYTFDPGDHPWPEPGQVARFYFGRTKNVRGLRVGEVTYFYCSPFEDEAEWTAREAEQWYEAWQRRPEYDQRYAALPEPLRRHIDYGREHVPGFRDIGEGPELHACEEAVRLAEVFGSIEELDAFWALPHVERLKRQLWLIDSGHSKGSHRVLNHVCDLARWYLQQ